MSSAPGNLRRAALVLAAVWAVLFGPQVFRSRGFVAGDAASIRAFATFSGQRWREHHERTHWNPYIFAGVPASVSLQDSRPQWLPDPLLEAFDRVHRLPGFPPLAIPLTLHLAGMIAMAALAQLLWGAGTLAMVWAGVAWGLLPSQLVPFAFGQDWLVMSSSLMPVILLGIARVTATEAPLERLTAGLGLSLAISCQFLAAHPQIIGLTVPLAAIFAIERLRRGSRLRTLMSLAFFACLGAAMGTAVWWPALLYNAHSVRGGPGGVSMDDLAAWGAGFPDLLALVWPWAAGFGGATYWGGLRATDFPQFIGTTVVALGLLGLARRDANRRAALVLALIAAASALLSLGLHLGAFYQMLYEHVPLWSSFRVAIRTLIVCQLAVVLLSARGLEHLIDRAPEAPRRWLVAAGAMMGVGLALAALLRSSSLAEAYAGAVRGAHPGIGAATALDAARRAAMDLGGRSLMLAALAALFAVGTPVTFPYRGAIAIALLVLDLGLVSIPFLSSATGSLEPIAHPAMPAIARQAAGDETARVLDESRERLYSNDWILWRVRSFTGNHPAVPREWDDMWRSQAVLSYGALCAFSIRYVGGVTGAPSPDTLIAEVLAGTSSDGAVWRLKEALPRAYAVPTIERLPTESAVLAALSSPDFDPRRVAFTTEDGVAGHYPGATSCRIRWLLDNPDHLEIQTSSGSPSFVVIADTWFPGWRASLDGRPVPIYRVQHMLRGLAMPAGTHQMRLDYEPEGWTSGVRWTRWAWGLWLSAVAAAAMWRARCVGARPPAAIVI